MRAGPTTGSGRPPIRRVRPGALRSTGSSYPGFAPGKAAGPPARHVPPVTSRPSRSGPAGGVESGPPGDADARPVARPERRVPGDAHVHRPVDAVDHDRDHGVVPVVADVG